MGCKIVADSGCDLSPELKKLWGVTAVPFTMTLAGDEFTDDETLNLHEFMESMKRCTGKIDSASPSPFLYKEAFEGGHTIFAVTLSGMLSGSYGSAAVGRELAREENGADVHIFDLLSASAGETLVAREIHRLSQDGASKSAIIAHVGRFIRNMKTYFVLGNVNNLLKNGRLGRITGKIMSGLDTKPIMGTDGKGSIALFSHGRGQKQILAGLVGTIAESGKNTEGEAAVITHCGNIEFAEELAEAIHSRHRFKEILVLPTGGLSSVYTDDKGVVLAF
jgi:DegV family protein with EDD domain